MAWRGFVLRLRHDTEQSERGTHMTKLGVAVIHGIGRHEKHQPEKTSAQRSFSAPLYEALALRLGDNLLRERVAWREVFWAEILQDRQDALEVEMAKTLSVGKLRKLVLSVLGDAANYSYAPDQASTYQQVHARMAQVLAQLDADTDGGPLLIVAHSLGGHIASNYIYDTLKHPPPHATPFQRFQTLSGLFTFGCNIPVFIFQHDTIEPIVPPVNTSLLRPWWRNYYGPSDVLGYPLAPAGGGYKTLARGPDPQLIDRKIRPGFPLIVSHSPLSHRAYWRSRTIHAPLEQMLREALATIGVSD